jgi:hypothetical protein
MVELLYLKHAYNEIDEALVERWSQECTSNTSAGWRISSLAFLVTPRRLGVFAQRSVRRVSKKF